MDGMEEQCMPNRQSSTRSCQYPPGNPPSRTHYMRRSLNELKKDIGKTSDSVVKHKRLEAISESDGLSEKRPSILERIHQRWDDLPNLGSPGSDGAPSVVDMIDNTLNEHYYTIAYCVVITAYMIGFAEYLYLRLVSIIIPDRMIYHKTCTERANETVGKDGFHYGVSIGAFIVIALFQLICFFGLTISEKWTKQSYMGPASSNSIRREQLASHIRMVISQTMYRTFLVYGICSAIICMIIFYMIGIQDSVDETASTICIYIFDFLVLLYFIAFPLCTVVYHPQVYCFKKKRGPNVSDTPGHNRNGSNGNAPLVAEYRRTASAELQGSSPVPYDIPPLHLPPSHRDFDRNGTTYSFAVQSLRDPPSPPEYLYETHSVRATPTYDPSGGQHFKRNQRITTTV